MSTWLEPKHVPHDPTTPLASRGPSDLYSSRSRFSENVLPSPSPSPSPSLASFLYVLRGVENMNKDCEINKRRRGGVGQVKSCKLSPD
jgi:hypothetical protein